MRFVVDSIGPAFRWMGGDELRQDLRDCGSVVVCDDGGVGCHVKRSEVVIEVEKKGSRSGAEKYWEELALQNLKIQGDLRVEHDAPLFGKRRPARNVSLHISAKCFRRHGKQVDSFG